MKTKRICPKSKSRFGVILSKNMYEGASQVLCFNGDCNFKMNILEWNEQYPKFIDNGFKPKLK